MNLKPYYITLCDFGREGIGHATDPVTFDDACDAYAECRGRGDDAAVFRIEPPVAGKAGAMIDVTADAETRIAGWIRQRNDDIPDWLAAA